MLGLLKVRYVKLISSNGCGCFVTVKLSASVS